MKLEIQSYKNKKWNADQILLLENPGYGDKEVF